MENERIIADGALGDRQTQLVNDIINKLQDNVSASASAIADFGLCEPGKSEQIVLAILVISYGPFRDPEAFSAFMEFVKIQYKERSKDLEQEAENS